MKKALACGALLSMMAVALSAGPCLEQDCVGYGLDEKAHRQAVGKEGGHPGRARPRVDLNPIAQLVGVPAGEEEAFLRKIIQELKPGSLSLKHALNDLQREVGKVRLPDGTLIEGIQPKIAVLTKCVHKNAPSLAAAIGRTWKQVGAQTDLFSAVGGVPAKPS